MGYSTKTYSTKSYSTKTYSSKSYYDGDAAAFIAYAGIVDATELSAINTLVVLLKRYNLWDKFIAYYPIVGGTAFMHSLNLKDPSRFNITWIGGPAHSTDGVSFDGATQYGKTGIKPSLSLTLNNTATHYYSRTIGAAAGNTTEIGSNSISATARLNQSIRFTGDIMRSDKYNTTTGRLSVANTITHGLFTNSRTSATLHEAFRNGASIGSNATGGGTLTALELYIGANNNNGVAASFSTKQSAFAGISTGFTPAEAAILQTLNEQYQTTLARNV